jgi:hypothetical protein
MLTVHCRLEWSASVLCSLFLLVTGDVVFCNEMTPTEEAAPPGHGLL